MSEPTNEQIALAVGGFTRHDLAEMRARMRKTVDELRWRAQDKTLPFRVRRQAAGRLRVRQQQVELYGEIRRQMFEQGALTVRDLGELAVARMCGYGAETEQERD